jgi:hypothetical protein
MPTLFDVTNESKNNTPSPNPLAAMLFFFIVTSIYCVISIFMSGDAMQELMIKICYILFVITGQYFINLNLSEVMCGVRQWKSAIYITFIPWIMIFGVLHLFLYLFPGWLSPFSNTFGYLVAKLMGLPDLMKKLLNPIDANNQTKDALLRVSNDSSLLINQFSPESYTEAYEDEDRTDGNGQKANKQLVKTRPTFDAAWKKLQDSGIIKTKFLPKSDANYATKYDPYENESYRDKLYNFVQLKYSISEYVWNILTGLFVTSISYNYIINSACEKTPKEMKERYDKYQADLEKKERDKEIKNNNNPNYVQSG